MKRNTPIKRSAIKRKPRKASEYARIFGSRERAEFVRALPCINCQRTPCVNAHTVTGGTGRKADYTTIVPLCEPCHRLQHAKGWSALDVGCDDLTFYTQYVERFWQNHLLQKAA